jgi:hypothetical protein
MLYVCTVLITNVIISILIARIFWGKMGKIKLTPYYPIKKIKGRLSSFLEFFLFFR